MGDEPDTCVFQEYCSCAAGDAAQKADRVAQERLQDYQTDRRIDEQWRGIPARFQAWRLSTSPPMAALPKWADRLLGKGTEPGQSLYLWGSYSVGKTGLAVGYARDWLEATCGVESLLFATLPDLLATIRATYRDDGPSEESVVAQYRQAGLLVLDDMGAEQVTGSGWAEDRLYRVIGRRHDELKPIVFTSNLSLKALSARIGERLTWRILEMCGADGVIHVKGPNLRDVKAP